MKCYDIAGWGDPISINQRAPLVASASEPRPAPPTQATPEAPAATLMVWDRTRLISLWRLRCWQIHQEQWLLCCALARRSTCLLRGLVTKRNAVKRRVEGKQPLRWLRGEPFLLVASTGEKGAVWISSCSALGYSPSKPFLPFLFQWFWCCRRAVVTPHTPQAFHWSDTDISIGEPGVVLGPCFLVKFEGCVTFSDRCLSLEA